MNPRRLALAAAVIALATTYPAAAAVRASGAVAPLPVGTNTHGVLARLVRAHVVVTFTRAAAAQYRRIAGRKVEVGCVAIVATTRSGAISDKVWAGEPIVAPHRRQPLRAFIGERGGRPDYCTVRLVRRHAASIEIAVVPVSERGAKYVNDRQTVREVLSLVVLALGATGRPTSPARMQALTRGRVVPVSGPEQRPPGGHAGYWTDGANEVYVGAVSHFGTLFFYEYRISSDVVTTNLLDWLSGQDDT